MADLSDINSALPTKIIGADATGVEQTPVQSTSGGGLHINLRNTAGTEVGTAASPLKIDVLTVPTATLALESKQDTQITALNSLITNIGTPFDDTAGNGTIVNNGDTVTAVCEGRQTAMVEISGTWTGSLWIECQGSSSTWYQMVSFSTAASTDPATATTVITANGRYVVNCAGAVSIRVKAVAAMTGTVTVYFNITLGHYLSIAAQAGTSSVTATPAESTRVTGSAAITGLVPPATPTDIFQIYGSAGKTINILRIEISATQTTGAVRDIQLIRRSTANTAGTSTTLTNVLHNSADTALTATVKAYTANPTLGTGTLVRSIKKLISTVTTAVDPVVWDFGVRPSRPLVLVSATDGICINLNSVTSAGNLFNISVEWTEF